MKSGQATPLKSKEEVQALLEDYLPAVGVEILKRFDKDDTWGFWVKYGEFPILIENPKDTRYVVVAFQITLSDEAVIRKLNEFYEQQDRTFLFKLTRVFTSPHSGFIRIIEGGRVIGFTVLRNVYPFHPGFTIRDLDSALQTVVGIGDVGIAFLQSVMGQMELDHTPPRPATEPGPMFE
jgi:hypothetical protein